MQLSMLLRRALVGVTIAALGLAVSAEAAQAAQAEKSHRGSKVTVMTRNLFLGGDLSPSISAPTLPALMAANAALLSHVDLVDFPARAKLLAKEIVKNKPDLVGLQEVATWRTGPLGDPAPATTVRYDYLKLLMRELDRHGHDYTVAVVQDEANLEAPAGAPHNVDARLTQHDVILVRKGGKTKVTRTASANFTNNLVLPLPSTGTSVTSTRGWTAVDVRQGRDSVRFINTHLEAFHPGIRLQQANELLAGPIASAHGDVILIGDLNSGPELPVPANRLAYQSLVAGGMVDTWPILHPGDPGFTASLGDDLVEPAEQVEHRIDMIMFKGGIRPLRSWTFGTERKTPDGRWASDHLGHVAVLRLR